MVAATVKLWDKLMKSRPGFGATWSAVALLKQNYLRAYRHLARVFCTFRCCNYHGNGDGDGCGDVGGYGGGGDGGGGMLNIII